MGLFKRTLSLGRLNHVNITTLYGMPRAAQDVYLVMELVNGQTLDTILGRLRHLGTQETMAIVCQTAAGLDYAHRMGVIHRDIKPSNLMLTETGVVKIMDFGIARIRGTQRLTRAGLVGTYAYLAPEQFHSAEGNERSDLYSMACVVYEMLSGNVPFDAPTEAEMMRGHLERPVRPLREVVAGIDQRIDQAVLRALAKDPVQRYASVAEFSEALGASAFERTGVAIIREQILNRVPPPPRLTVQTDMISRGSGGAQIASVGAQAASKPDRRSVSRRLPALVFSGAAAATVGLGFLTWQLWDSASPPPSTAQSSRETIGSTPSPTAAHPDASKLETAVTAALAPPEVVPRTSSFVDSTSRKPDSTVFVGQSNTKALALLSASDVINKGLSPGELVAEAQRRLSSGQGQQVNDALDILQYATKLHYAAAFGVMARIYDPLLDSRPPGLQPDLSQAARYYRAAVMEHDASAEPQREALHRYLLQRSQGGGRDAAHAAAILENFWR